MTVEFIQAEKRKHDTVLFPPFDLALTPGEVTAIQSSVNVREELLDLLSGRSSLTHGELKLEVNRPAGFFFLPTGLYERLTVKEMLRFIRQLHGSVQKIPDILRAMQLEDRQNEKISTLSFSEKKRVQLACLLVQDPAVFIFEEPDQNIDLESKRLYHRALQQLRQEEKTVLILTGNLENAVIAADRVCKLDETGLHMIDLDTDEAGPEDDLTPSGLTVRFEKIPTKVNDKLVLFNPPEIDYIESSDGLTHLHIKGEQFPSTFTLSELEERLLPFGFFRCHRSYLVNLQKVREVITWTRNSYSLILEDPTKTTIPLSKSKMTELKEMLGLK